MSLPLHDRPAVLRRYLARCRGRTIEPGRFDCALFAADWFQLCAGVDLAGAWRGQYRSFESGIALLEGGTHVDVLRSHAEPVLPGFALTGDLVVIDVDPLPALGIVADGRAHVLAPSGGLDTVRLARASEVFRP
ncbi:DUF6950 family protein [Litorisediminicola beolgyonensis]|uniref:DUF6950 family protein n=1 Tax=Litorisediminicola beolgyonensis TaxID=1173614 RepID=A0ABW3ZI77_9RHOB